MDREDNFQELLARVRRRREEKEEDIFQDCEWQEGRKGKMKS